MTKKPTLFLVGGGVLPTLDQIAALYARLTGREPTPEDLASARAILDEASTSSTPTSLATTADEPAASPSTSAADKPPFVRQPRDLPESEELAYRRRPRPPEDEG